jgi:hypothetical protein
MYTTQLIFHGAVILLVGLLCGAPLGSAVVRGKPEETVRAWRVAHSNRETPNGRAPWRCWSGRSSARVTALRSFINRVLYIGNIIGATGVVPG